MSAPDATTQAAWKLDAAQAAVAEVPDGCVLGLGTGTTADLMTRALAERVRAGLRVTGVATSERTRILASSLGITLMELDQVESLDMSIDGADEILLPGLHLVKGLGGALLREKLVAQASRLRVIIADATKVVPSLATHTPIPVEVIPFGWEHTARHLAALDLAPTRRQQDGHPFVSDGGNYLLDCVSSPLSDPVATASAIKQLTGVVDSGLFIGMTERIYVAGADGVRRYDA